MTIREAGPSLKSTTLTRHVTWHVLVLTLSYLHLHMIWIIEHGCVEVKACGQNTNLLSPGTITWNMRDGEPTTCIQFINLHKKSRQNLRQQLCRASILSDPYQNQEWLALVQSDDKIKINSESQTFHRPSVDRPRLWHSIPYCQWSYNSLWSQNIWWIQHPLTTKHLRVEWNMSHIMRAEHFIGSFADIWCLLR